MVTTPRQTPVGTFLDDGHSTKIAFSQSPTIAFWERTVKPLGFEGGDPIDTVTMFNEVFRTKAPRQLIDTTDVTGTAAYDPAILDMILAVLQINDWWTIEFPNGATWDFVGALRTFDPPEHTEGEFPLASFTITVTNQINGVETAPVYTPPAT